MKLLMWLMGLLIPREEGNGNDGGSDGGHSDSGGDADGTGGDAAASGDGSLGKIPDGKPDWLPEKFWNQDLKAPRTEVLAKSFSELEGKLRSKTDDLKATILEEMKASAPDEYALNLAEDLEIPEGVELDLSAEDPLVGWFFGFAKENGLSQEIVDSAINEYVKIELAGMTDINAELEKLGDHGRDRLLRVHNWMEGKLSDEQFAALNPMLSSAESIEALETLMKQSGPGDFEGDTGGTALTLEELREMQNDERYWKSKDPVFIKKVQDGYERLYKGQ